MRRTIAALIMVCGILFPAAAQVSVTSGPMDLVVLLDTSASMSDNYQQTREYLIGPFLKEFLRIGDTVHLIGFSNTQRLEITRRIEGVGDVETVIGRLLLLYPLDPESDISGALGFAEQYAEDIPGARHKKVILLSDGDDGNPEVESAVSGASARLSRQNADLQFIKLPITGAPPTSGRPRQNIVTVPPVRAPEPAATQPQTSQPETQRPPAQQPQGQQQTQAEPPQTQQQSTSQPQTQRPQAQQPQASQTQGQQTQGQPQQQPQTQRPQVSEAQTSQPQGQTQLPQTSQSQSRQQQEQTPQPQTPQSQQTPQTQARQPQTSQAQPSQSQQQQPTQPQGQTQLPQTSQAQSRQQQEQTPQEQQSQTQTPQTTQQQTQGQAQQQTQTQRPQTSQTQQTQTQQPQTRQQGGDFNIPLPLIIALIILGLLVLALIIFLATRRLNSSPNRVMAQAVGGAAVDNSARLARERQEKLDSASALSGYAANQKNAGGPQLTRPEPTRKPLPKDRPDTLNGNFNNGPPMLSLFVEDQNTAIGKRNIHVAKDGYSFTVGGGRSDFLIFLVPIPPHIADVHFDGRQCTFIPRKPQYFPDIGSQQVSNCIGKNIRVVSDKNYELHIRIERYEDPLKALNKLLHSIQVPGQ